MHQSLLKEHLVKTRAWQEGRKTVAENTLRKTEPLRFPHGCNDLEPKESSRLVSALLEQLERSDPSPVEQVGPCGAHIHIVKKHIIVLY